MVKRIATSRDDSSSGNWPLWGGAPVAAFSRFLTRHSWLLWVGPTLTVVACASGRLSAHYTPKVFWAALTTALGLALAPLVRRSGENAESSSALAPPHASSSPAALIPSPALSSFSLTPLGLFWSLYLAWALLSLLWAPAPAVGLERWEAILLPTAAYFLARRSRFWESNAFWFFFCILFGAEALLGFLEYASFDPVKARLAAWLPAAASQPLAAALDHFKAWVAALPGTSVPRATLGHRNYVAFYCMVALPFVAWSYFRARGWRAALVPGTALALGILFLLLSRVRGAWVGTALGALAALAGGGAGRLWRRPRHLAALACAGLLAFGLILLAKPSREFEQYGYAEKTTLWRTVSHLFGDNGRFAMWFEALGHSSPWLGAGFGNSPIVISPWSTDGHVKALNWELHNDYLQALMDLGIPGAVLFALAVAAALLAAWRARKGEARTATGEARSANPSVVLASLAALVGTAFMLGTTFLAQLVSTQMWLAGALAIVGAQLAPACAVTPERERLARTGAPSAGPALSPERERPARIGSQPSLSRVLRSHPLPRPAAHLLLAVAVLWLLSLSFRAYETMGADRLLVETQQQAPRVLADSRIPAPQRQEQARALVRAAARDVLPRARFDANMVYLQCYSLARFSAEHGALDAARTFAERGARLHPADPDILSALAQIALVSKRPSEALAPLEQIVYWYGYNPYADTPERLAALYDQLGQPAQALAVRTQAAANRVGAPADPQPGDAATGVPRQIAFHWSPSTGAQSYDLFLWREGWPVPDVPFLKNLKTPEAHPPAQAEPGARYYWRVRAQGRYHAELGPVWTFTTTAE